MWLLLEGQVFKLRVQLISARQDTWDLTGHVSESHVLASRDQLENLVANVSRSSESIPGGAGVFAGNMQFGEIVAELQFLVHDVRGKSNIADEVMRFRKGWNLFRNNPRPLPSQLVFDVGNPLGHIYLDVWLDRPLLGVPAMPPQRKSALITAPIFAPQGLFRTSTLRGQGSVEVHNSGDALVFPRVRWRGAGGTVTGPSGAGFELPASNDERVVDLSPRRLRLDGALPEGVPVGGSGTWRLPEGASLEWELQVASPYG